MLKNFLLLVLCVQKLLPRCRLFSLLFSPSSWKGISVLVKWQLQFCKNRCTFLSFASYKKSHAFCSLFSFLPSFISRSRWWLVILPLVIRAFLPRICMMHWSAYITYKCMSSDFMRLCIYSLAWFWFVLIFCFAASKKPCDYMWWYPWTIPWSRRAF